MRNATRVTVSIIGAIVGLMGIEHGIGEALQGNIAPSGLVISSWPGSEFFRILAGEPAMTVVFFSAFVFLLLTVFSGFARDIQRLADSPSGTFN